MPTSIGIDISYVVSNGPTFENGGVLDAPSLRMLTQIVVPEGATALPVEVNAGKTTCITALYIHFSNVCSFTIDAGTNVFQVANDTIALTGFLSISSFLNAISGGTTFNTMFITSPSGTTIDICAVIMPLW